MRSRSSLEQEAAQAEFKLQGNPVVPIRSPRLRDVERELFSAEDVVRIVVAQPELRDRVALKLLFLLGLRKGELAAIRYRDFNLGRRACACTARAARSATRRSRRRGALPGHRQALAPARRPPARPGHGKAAQRDRGCPAKTPERRSPSELDVDDAVPRPSAKLVRRRARRPIRRASRRRGLPRPLRRRGLGSRDRSGAASRR